MEIGCKKAPSGETEEANVFKTGLELVDHIRKERVAVLIQRARIVSV